MTQWPIHHARYGIRRWTLNLLLLSGLIISFGGCTRLAGWLECLKACDQPNANDGSTPADEPAPDPSSPTPLTPDTSPVERLTWIFRTSRPTQFTRYGGTTSAALASTWGSPGAVAGVSGTTDILRYEQRAVIVHRAGVYKATLVPQESLQDMTTGRALCCANVHLLLPIRTNVAHIDVATSVADTPPVSDVLLPLETKRRPGTHHPSALHLGNPFGLP